MTQRAAPSHDQLRDLLEICEDFFVQMHPAAGEELDRLLRARGVTGGPGWLIDMLGLTRLQLEAQRHHSS